jgi:hypothetical protein
MLAPTSPEVPKAVSAPNSLTTLTSSDAAQPLPCDLGAAQLT